MEVIRYVPMVVAFCWPIVLSRTGALSPGRWLILALGFFIVGALAFVAFLATTIPFWQINPNFTPDGKIGTLQTVSGLTFGFSLLSGLGSIFAAALHNAAAKAKPRAKAKNSSGSFLLDDRNW